MAGKALSVTPVWQSWTVTCARHVPSRPLDPLSTDWAMAVDPNPRTSMPARTRAAIPRETAKRFDKFDDIGFLLFALNSLTWFRRCGDQRRLLVTARIST